MNVLIPLSILLVDALFLPWILLGLVVFSFAADPALEKWIDDCPDPYVRLLVLIAWPWLLWWSWRERRRQ